MRMKSNEIHLWVYLRSLRPPSGLKPFLPTAVRRCSLREPALEVRWSLCSFAQMVAVTFVPWLVVWRGASGFPPLWVRPARAMLGVLGAAIPPPCDNVVGLHAAAELARIPVGRLLVLIHVGNTWPMSAGHVAAFLANPLRQLLLRRTRDRQVFWSFPAAAKIDGHGVEAVRDGVDGLGNELPLELLQLCGWGACALGFDKPLFDASDVKQAFFELFHVVLPAVRLEGSLTQVLMCVHKRLDP
jgi:hypothetical protein